MIFMYVLYVTQMSSEFHFQFSGRYFSPYFFITIQSPLHHHSPITSESRLSFTLFPFTFLFFVFFFPNVTFSYFLLFSPSSLLSLIHLKYCMYSTYTSPSESAKFAYLILCTILRARLLTVGFPFGTAPQSLILNLNFDFTYSMFGSHFPI